MKTYIKQAFEDYQIHLSELQIDQFLKYYHYLIQENQKFNLTAITDFKEVVEKHFIDSVIPYQEIPVGAKVIDIGTGAGFPGIPLKILRSDIQLTLLDSLQKRIKFLDLLLKELDISNVSTVHARAEDYCMQQREQFDIVFSRAVAALPTLLEYALPYLTIGGSAILYKSKKVEEELPISQKALQILGGNIKKKIHFTLHSDNSERVLLLIEKEKMTPKQYPRLKNLPKIKPIL